MLIQCPLPPNMANESFGHHMAKHRQKKAYYAACRIAIYQSVGSWKRESETRKMVISGHLRTWNPMDGDNLGARLKWPVDCLKAYGLIADDSPTFLEWAGVTQEINRKHRGVEFTLSPSTGT